MTPDDPNIARIDYWRKSGNRAQLTQLLRVGSLHGLAAEDSVNRTVRCRRRVLIVLMLLILLTGLYSALF